MSENREASVTEEMLSSPAEAVAETAPAPEAAVESPSVPAAEALKNTAKKVKKPRSWPLKILMELIAIILCAVIFVVTIAGSLVVDLRVMTSRNGIQMIVTQMIRPSMSAPADGSLFTVHSVSAPHLSSEILTDAESAGILTDVAYDMLKSHFGEELPVTKEQVGQFMTESTTAEFMTDKLAGVVEDFYNDTTNTTITRQEIVQIIEENTPLIEEALGVEITDDALQQVKIALEEVEVLAQIEEEGLIGYLEKTYMGDETVGESGSNAGSSEGSVPDSGIGSTPDSGTDSTPGSDTNSVGSMFGRLSMVKQAMEYVRMATSYTSIAIAAGVLLLLVLLLWLVNGTLPKTLSDLGITLLFAGLLLSSVNILSDHGVLQLMLPGQSGIIGLINGMLSTIAVVHYSILDAGAVLILLAIAAKIIKSSRQKKALLAAQ